MVYYIITNKYFIEIIQPPFLGSQIVVPFQKFQFILSNKHFIDYSFIII